MFAIRNLFFVLMVTSLVAIPFSSPAEAKKLPSFDPPQASKETWTGNKLKYSVETVQSSPNTYVLLNIQVERMYLNTNSLLGLEWRTYTKKSPAPKKAEIAEQKCANCHPGGDGSGGGESAGGGGGESAGGGGGESAGGGGGESAGGGTGRRAGSSSGPPNGDGKRTARSGASGQPVDIEEVDGLPEEGGSWVLKDSGTLPVSLVWDVSIDGERNPCIFLAAEKRLDPYDLRDPDDPDPKKRAIPKPFLLRKVAGGKPPDKKKNEK